MEHHRQSNRTIARKYWLDYNGYTIPHIFKDKGTWMVSASGNKPWKDKEDSIFVEKLMC